MTQGKFVERVISEITLGGRIPNKINGERLSYIINNAVRKFRDKDDRATMRHHMILQIGLFQTDDFRKTRCVKLPDCVKAVTDLKLSNRQYMNWTGGIDADFNKLGNFTSQFMEQGTSLLQAVASSSYYDFANTLVLDSVSYDFSEYSHKLVITGKNPSHDLVAEVYSYLCEDSLYEMPSFFDYVCGKCYEEYVIVTGITKMKLLNDYELNLSDIKEKGKDLISGVKDEWKEQLGESDFLLEWF